MKRNPNVPTGYDAVTGNQIFMDQSHHETHDGDMFCIAQGPLTATTDYLFTVPAGINAHLVFQAVTDATAAGSLELYPLITATANTAFSAVWNKKTAGGSAPLTVITTAPTSLGTTDATTRSFYGPLTVAGMVAGTLDRNISEYILTPGKHLLRVTRGASGNIALAVCWYEETV